ncbi:MAG: ABC transporter permease subunit [Pirellulales bacterium]|nr:ABC transporter permease subunit [Pirellulales bacterium]
MSAMDKAIIRRVQRRDRIARWTITLGGVAIIVSVIAILVLIVSVTLPLFRPPRDEIVSKTALPAAFSDKEVLALGIDRVELGDRAARDSLTGYVVTQDGRFTFLDFSSRHTPSAVGQVANLSYSTRSVPGALKKTLRFVENHAGTRYSLLWSDGSASLVDAVMKPRFDESGKRSVEHELRTLAAFPPEKGPLPLQALLRAAEGGAVTCVTLLPGNRLSVVRRVSSENLLGEEETIEHRRTIEEGIPGPIRALALDGTGKTLYAGTENGCLAIWQFDAKGQIVHHEVVPAFRDKRAVTALAMVFGDVSLAVGDARGEVTVWSEVRRGDSRKLRLLHRLSQGGKGVREILPSCRKKSLLSLDGDGEIRLDYVTSQRNLLRLTGAGPIRTAGYAPRGNAAIGLGGGDELVVWKIDCPHPEVSWATLFGKVHYEGYAEPEFKWQTTGEEPKFSLVPVIFGTLKATVYAMLFAVPLALFGAVYVSYFTSPGWKNTIKPVVEIMAALPSVVIGFLILLWFAPLLGRWIVAVFTAMVTIPFVFFLFLLAWQGVRKLHWAKRVEHGYEFLVLVPVMVAGAGLACAAAGPLERWLFRSYHGMFTEWLFQVTQKPYEQLNSLAVAFGLGFAVIPIIFSISEDSLSNIPYSLTAASQALGASRWQTLWRIILPSASPGIFAAVMIGFGRAVGETMIVFMAAGNAPLLDISPFNGFRTLSANIAVEIPEAPVGGTLYRVLFLCAVILFVMTFLLNTVAEVVRQRLRKRFGQY